MKAQFKSKKPSRCLLGSGRRWYNSYHGALNVRLISQQILKSLWDWKIQILNGQKRSGPLQATHKKIVQRCKTLIRSSVYLPEWFCMRDTGDERFSCLSWESPSAPIHNGSWYQDLDRFVFQLEQFLDGEESGLAVGRVEDGLNQ